MTAKKMAELIGPIVIKWRDVLGLQRWQIKIVAHKKDGARIVVDYRYLRAMMSVSADIDEDEAEQYVLHELLHILTGEIIDQVFLVKERFSPSELERIMKAEDRAVEIIARSLLFMESRG